MARNVTEASLKIKNIRTGKNILEKYKIKKDFPGILMGGNFLGGNFPGVNFLGAGGIFSGSIFPGAIFPRTMNMVVIFSNKCFHNSCQNFSFQYRCDRSRKRKTKRGGVDFTSKSGAYQIAGDRIKKGGAIPLGKLYQKQTIKVLLEIQKRTPITHTTSLTNINTNG